MNNTFYCVWWSGNLATPESQLMGIFATKEGAQALVERIEGFPTCNFDEVYYTTETTNSFGDCV